MNLKPIHKFNGGIGATLCHECRVIICEGLTDDLYCEKHGGKPKFNYKVIRLNDGLTKYGNTVHWVTWNEDGTFKEKFDSIVFDSSLVLDFNMGNFKWMTTRVKSYTIEGNEISFETKNSTYKLYANENK